MFKAFWENAWTKLLGHMQWIAGAAIASAPTVNEFVTNADVRSSITSLSPPYWVGPALVLLGVVTLIASEHKNVEHS